MRLSRYAYWPIAAALVFAVAAMFAYYPYLVRTPATETAYLGSLPKGTIYIASQQHAVLLALNESAWQRGLMNASYGDISGMGAIGMLFVFSNDSLQCFWMENTPMRLQQAWIANGTIAYVYNATPYSTTPVCHYGHYVLEVPSAYNITLHAGERAVLQG
jgi:uncharacterized membrane protein (UPF0127 family)